MRINKVLNLTIALLSMFPAFSHAEIIVTQPYRLSGEKDGHNGNAIQIQIEFKRPLIPSSYFEVLLNDNKILQLNNNSESNVDRFSFRLRLKMGEKLKFNIKYSDGIYNYEFIPTISQDFDPPEIHQFSPTVNSLKVESKFRHAKDWFGASEGDCLFLLLGVSMSGNTIPRGFKVRQNVGNVWIGASYRFSPALAIGLGTTPQATSCEMLVIK